jgi:hypothetical protein
MEHLIVKIHGPSGAGKTTVVRRIMERASHVSPFKTSRGKIEAYRLDRPAGPPVYVLGSYANNCGGMDTVADAATAIEMVDRYAALGHVLHEGLLQSTYYGAPGKASELYGDHYIFAFLDTPIDLCLDRVKARREENGSKNKFDPTLTIQKHETIRRLRNRLRTMGRRVVDLDYRCAEEQVEALYA